MELKVDEKTMESLVAKSLFDTFTEEQRNKLVMTAIQSLLAVPSSQYDKTPAIQRLFNEQVQHAARKIALDRMENDENFKAEIEKLFVDAAQKCFGDADRRSLIIDALVEGMRKTITGDRY